MRVLAGCDGGGTKCEVHVAVYDDLGQHLNSASAVGGMANVRTNPELAAKNIQATTNEAVERAGLNAQVKIDRYVAALAGAGPDSIQQQWKQRISVLCSAGHVDVVADAAILFAAADVDGPAVATVIGTGSIAWVRGGDGSLSRAGGLGPELGDEGSAFWIGREAFLRCLNRGDLLGGVDRLAASSLKRPLAQALLKKPVVERALTRIEDLPVEHRSGPWSGSVFPALMSQTEFASLSRLVFENRDQDPDAGALVREAAEQICKLIVDATTKQPGLQLASLPWICAGGVAKHQPAWLESIRQRASDSGIRLQTPIIVDNPAVGALKLATKFEFSE